MPVLLCKRLPLATDENARRFWSYVDIRDENQCWLWTGAKAVGYGAWGHPCGRMVKAHRYAFFLFYGGDPYPATVLHDCDTPACCNPHHMSLGDNTQNALDAISRGRRPSKQEPVPATTAKRRRTPKGSSCIPLPPIYASDRERFEAKYIKGPVEQCWEWTAAKTPRGYGVFEFCSGGKASSSRANRVAYAIHHDADPYPHLVRHICDNPPCVNPHHLVLGDHIENEQDKIDRQRLPYGDRNGSRLYPERLKRGVEHGMSKQTPAIAEDILRLAAIGELSYQKIADFIFEKYGVRLCMNTVRLTAQGKNSFGKRAD